MRAGQPEQPSRQQQMAHDGANILRGERKEVRDQESEAERGDRNRTNTRKEEVENSGSGALNKVAK